MLLEFDLRLVAGEPVAEASIAARQSNGGLRELRLSRREQRISKWAGDGEIVTTDEEIVWRPPANGGILRYRTTLDHQHPGKDASGKDAYVSARSAIFRGEDAFPIARWRRAKGTRLKGNLLVAVPAGWSLVTPYRPTGLDRVPIHNPGKRIARPLGWIIAGDLGTRRDVVDGIEIAVSAPRGIRMERIATLALLRWTLPRLVAAEGRPLHFVSIVAAGKPMWLGALSAPNSIFVNADRPLISENGTSTIVHEMAHVLLADLDTPRDQDWIDEGLAEYLSMAALRDSGTISAARFDQTIAEFRRWGAEVRSLRTRSCSGPVTARAVTIFYDLDTELRTATNGRQSLATIVRALLEPGRIADLRAFRKAAQAAAGRPLKALAPGAVPGFD